MKNIAIFASGTGTNAENIAEYFSKNEKINVALIVSNRLKAGVHERAARLHILLRYQKLILRQAIRFSTYCRNIILTSSF